MMLVHLEMMLVHLEMVLVHLTPRYPRMRTAAMHKTQANPHTDQNDALRSCGLVCIYFSVLQRLVP